SRPIAWFAAPTTSSSVCPAVLVSAPRPPLLTFLHPPAPRRALPSFPTRRSSDLGQAASTGGCFQRRVAPRQPSHWLHRVVLLHRDRKSTRLNSSHVSISYAVFCLKKKRRSSGRRLRRSTTSTDTPSSASS